MVASLVIGIIFLVAGFGNFCKGFFSMYRNPKAHNPKILEDTQLSQMTEVLVVATIIHNKLDNTYRTGLK